MKKVLFQSLLIISIPLNIIAQSKHFAGVYPFIEHTGKITKKFQYIFSANANYLLININKPDIKKDALFLKLYSEIGLIFNLNSHFSLTGSYAYERVNVLLPNYTNENRFYLQSTYKHSLKSVSLKYRLRFENRFVHNHITNKTPYTNRLRAQVGMSVPFSRNNNKYYFTGYEEAFFNTYKNASSVYSENKFYTAIGLKLNSTNKIEAGGLYQTVKTSKTDWFNQYYLTISWISQLDFTKNSKTKK